MSSDYVVHSVGKQFACSHFSFSSIWRDILLVLRLYSPSGGDTVCFSQNVFSFKRGDSSLVFRLYSPSSGETVRLSSDCVAHSARVPVKCDLDSKRSESGLTIGFCTAYNGWLCLGEISIQHTNSSQNSLKT